MLSNTIRALVGVLCMSLLLSNGVAQAQTAPTIAAAADLKFALTEVADRFQKETGQELKLTFGSSGNFATQLEQGAPFQLYFSADESFVHKLAAKGLTKDSGTLYAIGRIVMFVPHGSPIKADAELEDLKAGVADGRVKRFAIANPEHAPYGRRRPTIYDAFLRQQQ